MTNDQQRRCFFYALVASMLVGCADDDVTTAHADGEASGSLSLALVTPARPTFRLRTALFDVETLVGGLLDTLSSDASPEATALELELPRGTYQVELRDGWAIERIDGDASSLLPAALLTPNPTSFEIVPARSTEVLYRFATSDGELEFGHGQVSIAFDVTSTTSLSSCHPLYGCSSGQTCLVADSSGRTFCAHPGHLPVGAACQSEQCVSGAQCLGLDEQDADDRTCVKFCNVRGPEFGCNCLALGFDADVGVCGPLPANACDLLGESGCPEGQACQYHGGGWGTCGTPGTVAEGGACTSEECAAGMRCHFDEPGFMRGHCRRFCDTQAPSGSSDCPYCYYAETGTAGLCLD
jgi:hypothetical protein